MKKNLGFTLMELLVVISIIGILMALGMVSYTTAQKKGRDAKRKGDVKAMQNAMEQYYAINSGYGADASCVTQLNDGGMAEIPTDPKDDDSYHAECTADTLCICAYLESGEGNTECGSADYTSVAGRTSSYCMVNQQ